jgi:hypothetical protein
LVRSGRGSRIVEGRVQHALGYHVLADRLLQSDSALIGAEHLTAVAGQPVVIFSNHLSYSDANLLEILLNRNGGTEVSDRLTAIAGPKVYSSPMRRFSTLCFGTKFAGVR